VESETAHDGYHWVSAWGSRRAKGEWGGREGGREGEGETIGARASFAYGFGGQARPFNLSTTCRQMFFFNIGSRALTHAPSLPPSLPPFLPPSLSQVAKTSIALADADWDFLYLPSATFLFFLLGSVLSGFTISHDTFYLGR